jgi:ATP-dependent Clp protease ATP-binding subunit ClpC
MLDRLDRRLRTQQIEVEFTDDAVRLLAREGFDPEFGARPLRRTIQRLVENELSRLVLAGDVGPGGSIRVDELEGELHFEIQAEGAADRPAAEMVGREVNATVER